MNPDHYAKVAEIYQQGIDSGLATFEQTVPSWSAWDQSHLQEGRFVAMIDQNVAGWTALSPVSGRCVYAGVAEVSIYMDRAYRGRGLGRQLLEWLIQESEQMGIWSLQSAIFPQNTASLALHERCGFRTIGYREKIGQLHGVWMDTVMLERRSPLIGR